MNFKNVLTTLAVVAGGNFALVNMTSDTYAFPILGEVTPVLSEITCQNPDGSQYTVDYWMAQNKLNLLQQSLQHNDIVYGVEACM